MANWSIINSRVIVSPGNSVVPQRKPGEKAISAPCTSISASQINWSQRAVEIAAPVEQAVGHGQGFGQPGFVRCAQLVDQRVHRRVGLQLVGKYRQQPVAIVRHPAALDVEVHHAEELAVAAGVGDQGLAAGRHSRSPPARQPARRRGCGRRRWRRCRARGWPSSGRRPCRCATAAPPPARPWRAPRRRSSACSRPGCRRSSRRPGSAGWRSACRGRPGR